ncbi:MAG: penicillin-binding transpeptidase domain-containing protein [Candidatus Nealsonbacteria bacterium]
MFGRRLGKFKIKRPQKEIEFHEVLLDSLVQRRERELGISEQKLEVLLPQRILQAIWFGFLILSMLLFLKTAQLQIFEGDALAQASEDNRYVIRLIQAQRGVIYDSNMTQLVFNKPSFDLICRLTDLPEDKNDREKIFKNIAQIVGQDYSELSEKINVSSLAELIVAENLDYQTLILFEVRSHEFPGFETKNNTVREYAEGSFFSHLLGYVRKTGEKMGLEESYEDILKENPGELQIKRDVFGNPIEKEVVSEPTSGQSVVLYLNADLQKKLGESLEKAIKNVGSKSGAAIALDPKTGGVLAMINIPTFDNNFFSQGMTQEQWNSISGNAQDPLFNRVIAGEYPTGSVIKPLIASAALQEKIIAADKKINCLGYISIPNPWVANASTTKEDWAVHGWTDLRKAIAQSCNVYFYTVGGGYGSQEGLGPTRIKKYLELFGWSKSTQIDLAGERYGLIPGPAWKKEMKNESWWDGDTYNLAIGQGDVLATPLQVASAFAAIANGGTLYKPQVVKEVLNGEKFLPQIISSNFITPENLQIVREGMRDGVIYGSSALLNSLPVKAASKTGTAQTWQNEVYHNWVTVFAPYDDPQIVLTVLIENVKGMQVASLSVAQEALNWYFSP